MLPARHARTGHEKVLYAITHCQNIDIDTTTSARENRERAMEDDSDDGEPPVTRV